MSHLERKAGYGLFLHTNYSARNAGGIEGGGFFPPCDLVHESSLEVGNYEIDVDVAQPEGGIYHRRKAVGA